MKTSKLPSDWAAGAGEQGASKHPCAEPFLVPRPPFQRHLDAANQSLDKGRFDRCGSI
jgi:hypothetical protein